ncbi:MULTISPECIES: hypothetical protein [unclassified Pseudoxanthomonas]|uniref:hypothetical protein n=1 Tax=unclassified Pseudoxanthomonas TaxID=2645906 RepID=UPI0030780151
MRFSVLFLLVLTAPGALIGHISSAAAQEVQRCTTMTGESVYTDKRCEDIGAMDHLPSRTTEATASGSHLYRGSCSRTLSDLVSQISAAIDAQDVNRLAGVYQWAGISDAAANRILDRLDAVVQRPLVDIVPIRPAPPPIVDGAGNVVDTNADGYYPQTTQLPRPIGIRIVQTLKNSATPSETSFSLRRSYGCFWITL